MGEMTSLERVVAAIKMETPDRVPVSPLSISRSLRVSGFTTKDCLYTPVKMADGKLAAHKTYGDDILIAGTDLFVESEAMGSKTRVYDHTPVVVDYFLKDKSDIAKLKVPDPAVEGRMPFVRKEVELLKRAVGDSVVVAAVTGGPMTTASQLMGPEQLLIELVLDTQWAHQLLRICTDAALAYWDALIKSGVHAIALLDPFVSPAVLSPEQHAEFAAPYMKEIFGFGASKGIVPVNHICADTTSIWEQMAGEGAFLLQLDHPVDMARAKREVGGKICISGNVHPQDYMQFGKPEEVYWKCREVIEAAANGSGFILTSGCDLNPDTPLDNILAMTRAAKDTTYNSDKTVSFVRESYSQPSLV